MKSARSFKRRACCNRCGRVGVIGRRQGHGMHAGLCLNTIACRARRQRRYHRIDAHAQQVADGRRKKQERLAAEREARLQGVSL